MRQIDATSPEQPNVAARYNALCERAIAYLEQQGGTVHEDALVAYVFGKSASPALWRSLLHLALEMDDQLEYLPDGRWRLKGSAPADVSGASLLPGFVVIDVETTGLKPTSQRMTEIALIRIRDGVEAGRFDRLLNPGRRIPAYISRLTGIRDDDVADAAAFADLAAEIVEFIGDDLLVGHNVRFDIGFLNAELQRARHAKVINESIDTLALATRLFPGLRRPSLDRVAKLVGLTPRKIHRAGVDAEITAQVVLRLEAEARRQGVNSLEELRNLAAVRERRPRDHVGRGRSLIDSSLLDDIPRKPGVYLMRDADGRIIYVGKAKNLRERVGSYFSQPLGYARKMDGLLESIVTIDTEVVGSELEALLLESQLIRRHAPRYNTAMRAFEHYPYIRVNVGNRWPRVTLVKDRKDDGARYFGPYRSKSAAKKTVDVINDILPLRTCTRSFRNARSYGNPCLRLALGKCLGPCVDVSIAAEYRDMVHQVIRFLDGEDDALYEVLWAGLERAAETQDFERAEKLRRNLQVVNGIVASQRQLRDAREKHHSLMVVPGTEPGSRELWLVLEGRIWSRMVVEPNQLPTCDDGEKTGMEDVGIDEDRLTHVSVLREDRSPYQPDHQAEGIDPLARRLLTSFQRYDQHGLPAVAHDNLDDTHILNRWIAGNDGHPAIRPLDLSAAHSEDYWAELARWAVELEARELEMRPDRHAAGAANDMGADDGQSPST